METKSSRTNSFVKTDAIRYEYQRRLDGSESIAQLARENSVSESTMRWRLSELGIDLSKKAVTDGRYGAGGLAKYRVRVMQQSVQVAEDLDDLAKEYGITLSAYRSVDEKLGAILRVFVTRYSNLKIGEIMGVSEKSVRKWCQKFEINTLGRGDWAKARAGKAKVEDLMAQREHHSKAKE